MNEDRVPEILNTVASSLNSDYYVQTLYDPQQNYACYGIPNKPDYIARAKEKFAAKGCKKI